MSTNHTLDELQQMSDSELAELTAKLRGWTLADSQPPEEFLPPVRKDDKWMAWFEGNHCTGFAPHGLPHYLTRWNPAADVSQAFGLLTWAGDAHRFAFQVAIMSHRSFIGAVLPDGDRKWFEIPGNDARAMCHAFVLAMEATND